MSEQYRKVQTALQSGEMLILVGACKVQYEGRAESSLEKGERVVLVKPDGALLVHQPEGQKPVNWNPPGSRQKVEVHKGYLKLVSTRESPQEKVEILFSDLISFESFALSDACDINLNGSQDDIVDRVFQNPELVEPGFQPVRPEKDTGEGSADIYGTDRNGINVVCEVKRSRAEKGDASQLNRYVEGLEERKGKKVRGFLLAPGLTEGAESYLDKKGLEFSEIRPLIRKETSSGRNQKKLEKSCTATQIQFPTLKEKK